MAVYQPLVMHSLLTILYNLSSAEASFDAKPHILCSNQVLGLHIRRAKYHQLPRTKLCSPFGPTDHSSTVLKLFATRTVQLFRDPNFVTHSLRAIPNSQARASQ